MCEITLHGLQVNRVVVKYQQVFDHTGHATRAGSGLPVGHHGFAASFGQCAQAIAKEFDVAHKKIIVLEQQLDALFFTELQVQTWAAAHGGHQALRNHHVADFLAFALNVNRPCRVKGLQRRPDAGVKSLLGRLRLAGNQAQHRAAMVGQGFEVQHLRALRCQGL